MNSLPEEICIHFMSYAGIPFTAEIYAHNLNIDWGDGSISAYCNNRYFSLHHLYPSEGLFNIRISGTNIAGIQVTRLSLTALRLIHCPHLEFLNCSMNELEQLDLSACPALEELTCNSNNLRQIDFSATPKIVQINISYNMLCQLEVSGCAQLQFLCCSYNRLQKLSLENCQQLNHLECSVNLMDKKQLNNIFKQLPLKTDKAMICYMENPGSEAVNINLLRIKNWL